MRTFTFNAAFYMLTDANGNESHATATDPSDIICLGGKDNEGKYHHFESEAYHLPEWLESLKGKGITVEREKVAAVIGNNAEKLL